MKHNPWPTLVPLRLLRSLGHCGHPRWFAVTAVSPIRAPSLPPSPPPLRKTPCAPRCSGPAWKPPLSPSDSRGWGRDLGVIPGPLQFAHSPPTAAERTRPGPVLRTGRRPPVRSPWRHRAERAETILPLAEPQYHLPGSVRSASPREGSGHCIEGNTSSTHN